MKSDARSFFELNRPRNLDRWGDYGSILRNGLFDTENQCLDRAGPFVPPISFPGMLSDVVVTRGTRRQLEESGLSGIGEFRPVSLRKVVFIDWQKWDKGRELRDDQLPFNGEPEEYIWNNPHDPATASGIDQLWTWLPARIGRVLRKDGVIRLEGIVDTQDVFRLCDDWWRKTIVNEKGLEIVRGICGDWVTFERIENEILS